MKYNYEIVTTMKFNKLIYIDVMDLPCFGPSSVLVESELKLGVGIVVHTVPSCDVCQSI
jgi:hypothetical protein